MFSNALSKTERVFCSSGDRYHITYTGQYNEDGTVTLVETGKDDLYSFIQSFADSCDLNNILRRYASGEVDVLNKVQGTFGDFTEMPSSYAEMLNIMSNSKNVWDSLPVEIRANFGHDFNQYLAQAGTPDWYKRLGVLKDSPSAQPVQVDSVKEGDLVE